MASAFQHITRFVIAFAAFAGVLYGANMGLHGGDGEAALARAGVGGAIGAGVVTVYLSLRTRIRAAIRAMGQQDGDNPTDGAPVLAESDPGEKR
ncbi:MAG: hypothetical protein AAF224_12145 [Pseudomonadota bacterium]